jgi:hypothetical protein
MFYTLPVILTIYAESEDEANRESARIIAEYNTDNEDFGTSIVASGPIQGEPCPDAQ